MTVGELTKKLADFPADTRVVVYWEENEKLFGIDGIALGTGNPSLGPDNAARFEFNNAGPATWLFIGISPE